MRKLRPKRLYFQVLIITFLSFTFNLYITSCSTHHTWASMYMTNMNKE